MIEALVELIILHGPSGVEVAINPAMITSLRASGPEREGFFTEGVECMINLADGKFVTVRESCNDIRRRMREK